MQKYILRKSGTEEVYIFHDHEIMQLRTSTHARRNKKIFLFRCTLHSHTLEQPWRSHDHGKIYIEVQVSNHQQQKQSQD